MNALLATNGEAYVYGIERRVEFKRSDMWSR